MSSELSPTPTVILTGGTSGIGAEMRVRLLARGWRVIVLCRSARSLPQQDGLVVWDVDLMDAASLQQAGRAILAEYPAIHWLISNAAVQHAVALADPASTPAVLEEEVRLNLLAPALLAQLLLPSMIARGAGRIVNVSSGLALFPKERAGLYAATKAGLSSFSQSLRYQVERHGIGVTEVLLPLVDTPMTAGRTGRKLQAGAVAGQILAGVDRGRPVIRIGAARILPILQVAAPWLGRRIMRGS